MAAFGSALAVAGVAFILSGERVKGLAVVAMGLALLATVPLRVPTPRRELPVVAPVDGTVEAALVFRYSVRMVRAGTISTGLFTAVMIAVALWPDEIADGEPLVRPAGVIGTVLLGGMFLVGVANSRHGGSLALTPRGLWNGRRGFGVFVPWDIVEEVVSAEIPGTPLIGVYVTDRGSIQTSRVARFFFRLNRGRVGDVTLAPTIFQVEPAWVLATIRHYLEHPGDRRELGTAAAVTRFVQIAHATPLDPAS